MGQSLTIRPHSATHRPQRRDKSKAEYGGGITATTGLSGFPASLAQLPGGTVARDLPTISRHPKGT